MYTTYSTLHYTTLLRSNINIFLLSIVARFVTFCYFFSVIGGLLSAHLLAPRAGVTVEEGWPCQGPLLRLAVDVAERLLPGWYIIMLTTIHQSGGEWWCIFTELRSGKVNIHHFHGHWGECFSICHPSWIPSRPKSNFICDNIPTKAVLFFFSCSEVNRTWLITSELANLCTQKVLFTSGVRVIDQV